MLSQSTAHLYETTMMRHRSYQLRGASHISASVFEFQRAYVWRSYWQASRCRQGGVGVQVVPCSACVLSSLTSTPLPPSPVGWTKSGRHGTTRLGASTVRQVTRQLAARIVAPGQVRWLSAAGMRRGHRKGPPPSAVRERAARPNRPWDEARSEGEGWNCCKREMLKAGKNSGHGQSQSQALRNRRPGAGPLRRSCGASA